MRITFKRIGKKREVFLWSVIFSLMILLSISAGAQPLQKGASFFKYTHLFSFPTKKAEGEKAFGRPRNLAINSSGQLYVVVPYAKEVRVYNLKGEYRFSFGMRIKRGEEKKGKFSEPSGITIDHKDLVYVSDLDRDMVLVFNPDGTFIQEFPIFQPRGKMDACAPFISFNPLKELLYIPDPCVQRVNIYTTSGQFITAFGEMGSNIGEFGGPASCAFTKEGEIYIVDPGNFRVQSFGSNHQAIDAFGVKGTKGGEFVRPYGIGIDSADRIFVSDFVLKSIQVFSRTGRLLGLIEEKSFKQPLGVACSKENRIYVVDGEGQAVHVFQMD